MACEGEVAAFAKVPSSKAISWSILGDNTFQYMHRRSDIFTMTPISMAGRSPNRNCPKEILLCVAMTKFCGLPIGVAEEPMFALEAKASKKGWGGTLFCFAVLKTNSVRTMQLVSLVNNALDSAEIMQIRQSKSFAP
ncbi:hypothetical protein PanWU01x14_135750 [Parasponia andersonii]|uniref:Uncharacterized protein n=1 Tax=Parasponia andersonii TaxID=3476 RepID=A0A2P5CPC7_PARAD|nr:hypothetical protein PanWU01x14_135750 [Parasponia andersonii]